MFGRVKLDNTLLTCDQGNFNQITTRSRNRTLVTVVRHVHYHCATSTTTKYHRLTFVSCFFTKCYNLSEYVEQKGSSGFYLVLAIFFVYLKVDSIKAVTYCVGFYPLWGVVATLGGDLYHGLVLYKVNLKPRTGIIRPC